MNIIDVLIIILVLGAVGRGLRYGFLQLALSSVGFIAGLLLGSWAANHLATHLQGLTSRFLFILGVELFLAFSLSYGGEVLGLRLSHYARRWKLGKINNALGAVLEIVLVLAATWLVGSGLANVQYDNLGRLVRNSAILGALDRSLPPPPDLLAQVEKALDPNGFPNVFVGLEPQHTTVSPNNHVNNQAVLADENSVVKIEGQGCGGVVEGSGFVAYKGIVVTNAHVIAGIESPHVIDHLRSYSAIPIWFDPNMDLAVLQVANLPDAPLSLSANDLASRDAAVVLGFPGGGPLVLKDAVVIDKITAAGQNIYNRGVVYRDIYELQTDIEPGNSGGPLIGPDGTVAGIVFAKSVSQNDVGYGLVTTEVRSSIQQANNTRRPVSTGSCAQD